MYLAVMQPLLSAASVASNHTVFTTKCNVTLLTGSSSLRETLELPQIIRQHWDPHTLLPLPQHKHLITLRHPSEDMHRRFPSWGTQGLNRNIVKVHYFGPVIECDSFSLSAESCNDFRANSNIRSRMHNPMSRDNLEDLRLCNLSLIASISLRVSWILCTSQHVAGGRQIYCLNAQLQTKHKAKAKLAVYNISKWRH